MKIVPTIYENLGGVRRYPYQYTFVYRVSILFYIKRKVNRNECNRHIHLRYSFVS